MHKHAVLCLIVQCSIHIKSIILTHPGVMMALRVRQVRQTYELDAYKHRNSRRESQVPSAEMTVSNSTSSMHQSDRASISSGNGSIRKNRRRLSDRKITKIVKDLPLQTPAPKGKLSQNMKLCSNILKELFSKKHESIAWPFYNPVDTVQLSLNDYKDIVKRPMDLSTVQLNMQNGVYNSPHEFVTDVRLIFTNCYRYNSCESDVVKLAQELQQVFETLYAKIEMSVSESSESSDWSSDDLDERISQFQKQLAVMGDQLRELVSGNRTRKETNKKRSSNRKSSAHSQPAKTKPSVLLVPNTADGVRSMSYAQAKELSVDLANIRDPDQLMKIFHIVKSREPNMVNDCNPSEYEVPLCELQSSTLWELKAFSDAYKSRMVRPALEQTEMNGIEELLNITDLSSDSDSDSSSSNSSSISSSSSSCSSDTDSSICDVLTF